MKLFAPYSKSFQGSPDIESDSSRHITITHELLSPIIFLLYSNFFLSQNYNPILYHNIFKARS